MNGEFLDQIEAFATMHGGLDTPAARHLCRQLAQGEHIELPEAVTADGAVIRQLLTNAIASFAAGSPHASAGAGEPAATKPVAAASPRSRSSPASSGPPSSRSFSATRLSDPAVRGHELAALELLEAGAGHAEVLAAIRAKAEAPADQAARVAAFPSRGVIRGQ